MALIKCIDCGREISENAQACPNCGCTMDAIRTVNRKIEQEKIVEKARVAEENKLKNASERELIGYLVESCKKNNQDEARKYINRLTEILSKHKFIVNKSEYSDWESYRRFVLINSQFASRDIIAITDISKLLNCPIDEVSRMVLPGYQVFNFRELFIGVFPEDISSRILPTGCFVKDGKTVEFNTKIEIVKKYISSIEKNRGMLSDLSNRFSNYGIAKVEISMYGKKPCDLFAYARDVELRYHPQFNCGEYGKVKDISAASRAAAYNALSSMLAVPYQTKKPMSVGTSAGIGAALAGTPGAIIGAASALEKNAKYNEEHSAEGVAARISAQSKAAAAMEEFKRRDGETSLVTAEFLRIQTIIGDIIISALHMKCEDKFITPDLDEKKQIFCADYYTETGKLADKEAIEIYRSSWGITNQEIVIIQNASKCIKRGEFKEGAKLLSKIYTTGSYIDNLKKEIQDGLEKQKKYTKMTAIVLGICILLGIVFAGYKGLCIINEKNKIESQYNHALDLREAGEYEEAIKEFNILRVSKDTAQDIEITYYEAGEAFFSRGDYENAAEYYAKAGEYNDSNEKKHQAKYELGKKLLDEKKYEEAMSAFSSAGTYGDAESLVSKCNTAIRYLEIASRTTWDIVDEEDLVSKKELFDEYENIKNEGLSITGISECKAMQNMKTCIEKYGSYVGYYLADDGYTKVSYKYRDEIRLHSDESHYKAIFYIPVNDEVQCEYIDGNTKWHASDAEYGYNLVNGNQIEYVNLKGIVYRTKERN